MATHWTLGCDAADLVAEGATVVRDERYGDRLGHVVMLDPEGNEFCVEPGPDDPHGPSGR